MVLNTIWHKPVWVRVPEGVQKCIFLSLFCKNLKFYLAFNSGILVYMKYTKEIMEAACSGAKCCKGKRRSAGGYLWRYKE